MTTARVRPLLAAALAVVAFVAVAVAQRDQGIARDEVVYITSGDRYADWWIALVSGVDGTASERAITASFGGKGATDNNREHPPLMKTLFGFSSHLFHRKLGWASRVTASRLPTAAINALLVALVFLLTSRYWGTREGVVAGALALLLPRAFFHAGLAAFDAPIAALWFATLYAYLRALESRRWCVGLGICFGLALATKHNAVMLPAALLAHAAWLVFRARRRPGPGAVTFRQLCWVAGGMAIVAPLVLIAVWPWLWFDTFAHLRDWLRFHLSHVHYNFEYLGTNWNAPPFPWHVPFVTTLLTVPVVTLAAGGYGAGVVAGRARRGAGADPDRAPALLLALSAAVAIGPFLIRTTPIFGAEKHWGPAIPSLCVFAGIGVITAARQLVDRLVNLLVLAPATERSLRAIVVGALSALVVAAAFAETTASRPYALSHYNALAGGAPGAADLGMNRQFWGYAARGILPYVNQFAPVAGKAPVPVYAHDASPAWPLYLEQGLLAPGLRHAGQEQAGVRVSKVAIVVHEKHFLRHDLLIWREYGTVQPRFVLTFQGVPLVSVYAR